MTKVFRLALWRFSLLRRQKIFSYTLAFTLAALVFAQLVASSSFIDPQKVFWDFSLGIIFLVSSILTIHLSTFLYSDEHQRRTMHLVLASGMHRRQWVWGNVLGLYFFSVSIVVLCTLFALLWNTLFYSASSLNWLLAKAQLALIFELSIVATMSFFFSVFLRPLIAFFLALALVFFLHSQVSLVATLLDPQTSRFNNPVLMPIFQWIVPLLPPLEWFDLRILIGHEAGFSWSKLGVLFVHALGWTCLFLELSFQVFKRKDI